MKTSKIVKASAPAITICYSDGPSGGIVMNPEDPPYEWAVFLKSRTPSAWRRFWMKRFFGVRWLSMEALHSNFEGGIEVPEKSRVSEKAGS